MNGPAIVWFLQDLRILDNPVLVAALQSGAPVIPVFIWSPEEAGAWRLGAASQWWLPRSASFLVKHLLIGW